MKTFTLSLTLLCLMHLSGGNATVLWEADFESPDYTLGPLTGQQGWYDDAGQYQTVTTEYDAVTAAEGSQFVSVDALGITFNSNFHAAVVALDKTNNYLRLSYYVLRKGNINNNVGFWTEGNSYILVQCAGGSLSLPWNGGATLGSYDEKTWSHVVLDVDCMEETIRGIGGSVNGVLAPLFSAPCNGPGLPHRIRMRPYGGSNLVDYTCFDHVKVETTPAFRVSPDRTSLDFTSAEPQVLILTPDLSGLSYDVTVSSTYSWVHNEPSTFTVTDSPVAVTVSVNTASLDLPISASIDVVSAEGVRKRLAVNVRDSLIAYDGYDYDLGVSITNLNGGTGWDGPWFQRSGDGFTAESVVVDGLTYSVSNINLQTTGNAAYMIPAENLGYHYGRALATSLGGDQKTVWISMLCQPKLTAWATCDLFFNPNWGGDQGAFGCQWGTNWKFVNGASTAVPGTLDETFFIVVRYDLDGDSDTAWMWVNPGLQNEANIADADATQTKAMPLGDGVDWIINHNHTGTERGAMIFDELRIGDTWEDVAPTDVPGGVKASDGTFDDKIRVTWNPLEGASTYTVYRADTNDSSVASSLQSGITTNVYDDTSAVPLQIYWYWVKSDLSTAFSGSDSGYRSEPGIPLPPENVQASDGTYTDKIVITCDPSENAEYYIVLRNTANNSSTATNISGQISTNYYEDTSVVQGASYYYWVQAGNASGVSFPSSPDTGYTPYDAIAYEGFDYPVGESIGGKEGGLGWDGPWIASADTVHEVYPEGLTYPGLQTSGKSVKMLAVEASGKGTSADRNTGKDYGAQTNDIWYSFLLKADIPQVGHVFAIPNGTWNCGSGKAWGNTLSLHNWHSDIVVDPEETYFLVVRCINGGAYLWINPSLEREPLPGVADVSQDVTTLSRGHQFNINAQRYYETNSYIFDEIRVGYTWNQVSPNYIVKNVQASDGTYDDKVVVNWDTRGDAVGYTVYRNTVNDSSSATAISSELTGASYDDTTGTAGTIYYYWIKGRFIDGTENFSYSDAGYRAVAGAPAAPQNVTASDGVIGQTYVHVTWDTVTGADVYRVFRNSMNDYASAEAVSSDIVANEYDDSDVAAGVAYYYWVRAKNATGWSNFSDPDTGYIPAQQVAYYAMDELEGTNMLDSSENEFDGLYRDNPTLGVASADAILFNTAVKFDVSDAVINSNSPIRDLTNNFTVALWVNPDEIGQDEYRYLFAPEQAGGWNLSVYNRNIVFDVPGAGGTWSPANVLTNGVWTHVAVTYNHLNYARMFINGYQVGDEQYYGVPAQYVKCDTLVANGGEQELFFGSLDEIHVYSGVLSDDEILLLAGIPEPGMLGIVMLTTLGAFIMRRR